MMAGRTTRRELHPNLRPAKQANPLGPPLDLELAADGTPVLPWGKYAGRSLAEIALSDRGYLVWASTNHDINARWRILIDEFLQAPDWAPSEPRG